MVMVERDSGPIALLRQNSLEQIAHMKVAFEDFQGGRSHNLLGNLCQRSITHRLKNCVLIFRQNECVPVCVYCLFWLWHH